MTGKVMKVCDDRYTPTTTARRWFISRTLLVQGGALLGDEEAREADAEKDGEILVAVSHQHFQGDPDHDDLVVLVEERRSFLQSQVLSGDIADHLLGGGLAARHFEQGRLPHLNHPLTPCLFAQNWRLLAFRDHAAQYRTYLHRLEYTYPAAVSCLVACRAASGGEQCMPLVGPQPLLHLGERVRRIRRQGKRCPTLGA